MMSWEPFCSLVTFGTKHTLVNGPALESDSLSGTIENRFTSGKIPSSPSSVWSAYGLNFSYYVLKTGDNESFLRDTVIHQNLP